MNNRNFYRFLLLWGGELLSGVGSGLTSFGLSIYVLHATGRAASMGLVSLAAFLPVLLLSVPAGVLADRYDRRLLMMAGDSLSALGILYISLCMHGGGAALWQICLGVAVSAVFSALLEPAYRATVTDLLTEKEFSRASGLVSLAGSARYLISPVLAGIVLSVSDIKVLLILDVLTFFPTVLAAAIVRKDLPSKKAERENISFGRSMKEGWNAVSGRRGLLVLVSEFVKETYGQTLSQLWLALWASVGAGVLIILVVMGLFCWLRVEQKSRELSLCKALGLTRLDCQRMYFVSGMVWVILGVAAGLFLGISGGEWLCGLGIGKVKAYACCLGRE